MPWYLNPPDLIFVGSFLAVALLGGMGILWSPFSALLCARITRKKGWKAEVYAIAGFATSLMLFLPSLYLIARLLGQSVPRAAVITAHIFILAIWAAGPLLPSIGLASDDLEAPIWQWATLPGPWHARRILTVAIPLSGVVLWFVSLLTAARFVIKSREKASASGEAALPDSVGLTPFLLLPVSLILSFTLWAIRFAIDPDGTRYL